MSHQNSYIEALNFNVPVFGDMAFRRQLRVDKVIMVKSWSDRNSTLKRRGRDTRALSLCHAITQQEGRSLQKSAGCHLDFGLPSLQNCEKINFCCLRHPVCGISLWKSKLTNREMHKEPLSLSRLKIEGKF